jgi:hypothetical protein
MSYTRTAIASAIIVTSLATAGSVTQPVSAAAGLARTLPPQEGAHSHRPALQAPEVSEERIESPVINAETDELHAMAEWALAEMENAGLTLPPVIINLHSDRISCSSNPDRLINGYHTEIDGQHIVHSCGNRWTLLHELGHVWDDHHLDDDDREEIMRHQGIDSWHGETWGESGSEHVACLIAWAIDGTRPTRIGRYSDEHLAEAYRITTGMEPPSANVAQSTPETPAPAVATAELPDAEMI